MNKIFSIPVLITFSLLLFSTTLLLQIPTQSSAQKNSDTKGIIFKTYTNPTFGIQMQYPSDWTVAENKNYSVDNTEVANFSSPVSEDVAISVDSINDNRTLVLVIVIVHHQKVSSNRLMTP